MNKKFAVIYGSYFVESGLYTEILAANISFEEAIKVAKDAIKTDEQENECVGQTKLMNDHLWEYRDTFNEVIRTYKIQELKEA